jgi:hypothetical protein
MQNHNEDIQLELVIPEKVKTNEERIQELIKMADVVIEKIKDRKKNK